MMRFLKIFWRKLNNGKLNQIELKHCLKIWKQTGKYRKKNYLLGVE